MHFEQKMYLEAINEWNVDTWQIFCLIYCFTKPLDDVSIPTRIIEA